jgi:aldose 1-epimerase
MPDGTPVELFTLVNSNGLVCKAITYGASITELHVPDRKGEWGDVVLGYQNLEGYLTGKGYIGSVIGRFANRIAHGTFMLDGVRYTLPINNPPNTLHGGFKGFGKRVWNAKAAEAPDGPSVVFQLVSPDGDEGFPGTLAVRMTYTLTNSNDLRVDYEATTDKATPVSLTNHSYFNLSCGGDILRHMLQINACLYTPVNRDLIPTGAVADVTGTPLDFRKLKAIGSDIHKCPPEIKGYDNNFVLDTNGSGLAHAACVDDPFSGRTMDVLTDQPGMQLYSSNGFDGTEPGKGGVPLPIHGAICLETQQFPNAINEPGFPSPVLRPGTPLRTTTIYRFGTR